MEVILARHGEPVVASSDDAPVDPDFDEIRIHVDVDGRGQVLSVNEVGHFDASRERRIGPEGEGFGSAG
jgi:hypothetical protein